MDYEKIKFIQERIRSKIIPTPRTIKELLETKEVSNNIKTRLPILDLYLRGGIQPDHITEIVGAPGVGKTQFCQMLTVLSLNNHLEKSFNFNYDDSSESTVIYFDTEQSSSASRLKEIAQSIYPDYYSKEENITKFMNRVFIIRVTSSNDLLSHLKELEEKIIEYNVKLIIVDSIASIVRKEFDSTTIHKRQHLLNDEASLLKFYAESFHIPVVVTNQVHSIISSPIKDEKDNPINKIRYATAALGTVWSHCVNTRLVLEYYHPNEIIEEAKDRKLFRMIIAKSPVSPVISFPYYIDSNGLNLIKKSNVHGNMNEIDDYYMEIDSSNYWDQMIMCNNSNV